MSEFGVFEAVATARDRIVHEFPDTRFCFVGGIVTDALLARDTNIDTDTHMVGTAIKTVPIVRTNGTKRDVDIVAFSPDQSVQNDIKRIAQEAVTDAMVVNVARQMTRSEKISPLRRLKSINLLEDDGTHTLAIGPFEAAVPESAIHAWSLTVPGDQGELPIFSPRYHELNYYLRSICGARPKDTIPTKLPALQSKLSSVRGLWTPEANQQFEALDTIRDTLENIRHARTWQAYRTYGSVALLSKGAHAVQSSSTYVKASHLRQQFVNRSDTKGQERQLRPAGIM